MVMYGLYARYYLCIFLPDIHFLAIKLSTMNSRPNPDAAPPHEKKNNNPPIRVSTDLKPQYSDLQLALKWLRNAENGQPLTRSDIRPEKMIPLIRMMSLFDVIRNEDNSFADLYVRVFSSSMTEIYGEMTGHHTSVKLPSSIQERFLHHVQIMLDTEKPVFSRTKLTFEGKTYITVEAISAPVWSGGNITQCLNFFSYK